MFKKLSNLLKDIRRRSSQQADQPYIPLPPEATPVIERDIPQLLYEETDINIHEIAGTSIGFGTIQSTMIDHDNRATDQTKRQSQILGSGRVVSRVEPEIIDGTHRPGVGGVCCFCQAEAISALQAGVISPQQAELRSLFDTKSASHCDGCGRRDVCVRHSRPFKTEDGAEVLLCVDCMKAATRQQWTNRAVNILLTPFLEKPQLPSGEEGD